MENLHPIQLKILTKLLQNENLRYSEMKPKKEMGNNLFQFHLNQLLKLGLVVKTKSLYSLTKDGKKLSLRIDSDSARFEKQAKIGVALGCMRNHKGKKQILVYTRLKHAYYGCQGFPAGKIKYGEDVKSAAKRELKEETGLIADPEIAAVLHYNIYNKTGEELFDDLLLFLCRFDNPKGNLVESREGKYEWVDLDLVSKYIRKPFQSKKLFMNEVKLLVNFDGNPKIVYKTFNDKSNF